jgi:hypothetical protein
MDVVKSIILSQLLLENNEELKGTKFYRQELKRDLNKIIGSLDKYSREYYDTLYNNDNDMVNNIMNRIEALTMKLSSSTIEDLILIDAVIDKYNENKEWFKKHEQVDFLKINQ